VEGVRTSHHGPQVTEEMFGADTVVMQ